jgi:flavodoxin
MIDDLDRRALLSAPALLAFATATGACAQPAGTQQRASSKTLIAYFTRSGNTRVIAETLQRLRSADIFEIQPARPYPADYEETVEQARQERDRGYEPPLAARVTDIRAYDTVFLGFPIWGETAPPVIRSFLKTHDLSGKTLRPFITHGGYGAGNSQAVLQARASGARIEAPFVMEADQERRTLNQVKGWLQTLGQNGGS